MKKFIFFIVLYGVANLSTSAEVIHGIDVEFAPFVYLQDGKPAGLSVELLNLIIQNTKDIEVQIDFYPMKRSEMMISEEKNAFALNLTRNPARETQFKWVGPTFPRIIALYKLRSRSELQIYSLADVRKYKVGAGRGYAAVNDLLEAGMSRERIEEVNYDIANIKKLFARRIDFVANNNLAMAHLLRQEGYSFDDVEQAFILQDKYQYYYGFNKATNERIIQQLQQGLEALKLDGTYDKLLLNYLK